MKFQAPVDPPPDEDRSCKGCQVCCEVLPVRPGNDEGAYLTRYFERCQWQCEEGCRIYGSHPSPCAAYHCMWRLGWGDDDARPDRLGILVEGSPNGWMFVVEARPGGAEEELAQQYLARTMSAEDSPAEAIHITPWGTANPDAGGYWIGNPEITPEKLMAILQAVKGGS